MTTLIVDDEKHSHESLAQLMIGEQDVKLLGHAFSVEEGVEMVHRLKPELVFLDVEMPDGTGFDLLKSVGTPSFHVIFITAYNKYAETAFRFGALDFLTKPLQRELLEDAIDRVRQRRAELYTLEQLQIALETFQETNRQKLPRRMAIVNSKGLEMINVSDILYLEADWNYTNFHFWRSDTKQKLNASLNLAYYLSALESYPDFMKVHRSYMVNLMHVYRYLRADSALEMRDGSLVPVARANREAVETKLRGG